VEHSVETTTIEEDLDFYDNNIFAFHVYLESSFPQGLQGRFSAHPINLSQITIHSQFFVSGTKYTESEIMEKYSEDIQQTKWTLTDNIRFRRVTLSCNINKHRAT
jgi:hypothetical protein